MSEMVERVARAMYGNLDQRGEALAKARVAIEAMRRPTRPMLDAAWNATKITGDHPKGVLSHKAKTKTRWNAMIDAAIK